MGKFRIPPLDALFAPFDGQPYARLILRWSWLVILCALLGGLAAFVVSNSTTPIYQVSSRLLINEARTLTNEDYNNLLASERAARTYAEMMTRLSTVRQTFARLGLEPATIDQQITDLQLSPVRDTRLIDLTVEGYNPDLLILVANTLPQVFVEELRTVQTSRFAESKESLGTQLDSLSRQIEETQIALESVRDARTAQEKLEYIRLTNILSQYQASYSDILQNYETLRLAEAQSADNIVVAELAEMPESPIRPRTLVNTLLAAIAGAMLALGIVFLVEYLDDRIRTPGDLGRITDLPVIGIIGRTPGEESRRYGPANLISLQQPRHPTVEAYRRLRTSLQFYDVDKSLKSISVTSAGTGEGKSITAANLAIVMAQSGLATVLIDSDLRRPRQHQLFALSKAPGLSEAILTDELAPFLRAPDLNIAHLRILTAGASAPFPAEMLGSQRMVQLIERLDCEADILIFDTPPVLAVTDATLVGRLVDTSLLIIDSQQTTSMVVRRALEALTQVNVPTAGAVLNRVTASTRDCYYTYGYHHYRDADGEEDAGGTPAGGTPAGPLQRKASAAPAAE